MNYLTTDELSNLVLLAFLVVVLGWTYYLINIEGE